jgi:hypothetical protein
MAAGKPAYKQTCRKSVSGKSRPAAGAGKGATAAAAAAAGAGKDVGAAEAKQKKPRAPREPSEPVLELPLPEKDQEYSYAKGKEPWRSLPQFCYPVHEELDSSAAAVARIRAAQKASRVGWEVARVVPELVGVEQGDDAVKGNSCRLCPT